MKQYSKILQDILENGSVKPAARENLPNTKSVFDREIRITDGSLPILMGKKVLVKNVISELCWFLRGDSNIQFLNEYGNHIWNEDAYRFYLSKGGCFDFETFIAAIGYPVPTESDPELDYIYKYGDCGRIYGYQWRHQGKDNIEQCGIDNSDNKLDVTLRKPVDQITNLIEGLINNPFSRYHIVDAWNQQDMREGHQALPACHTFFQCNVREERHHKILDISIWQRSCDMFLGVPYNLLSYGILHRLLCRITGYRLGAFVWHGADCHIYDNQIPMVKTYLNRCAQGLPKNEAQVIIDAGLLERDYIKDVLDAIEPNDISIINYNPMSFIAAPLSTGLIKHD